MSDYFTLKFADGSHGQGVSENDARRKGWGFFTALKLTCDYCKSRLEVTKLGFMKEEFITARAIARK